MEFAHPEALVSADWLAEHYQDPDIRIVDATHHLPISERDAKEEFGFRHIPGAVFFDVDDICNQETDLPHMIPSPESFAERVGRLGIGNEHRVVVYDTAGGFLAAARVWWMFRLYGHVKVMVLDGGLPQWGRRRLPVEKGRKRVKGAKFKAGFNPAMVRDITQVQANLDSGAELVVDARSPRRFLGQDWEPRKCKRLGHIPGSVNLPFPELMVSRKDYLYRSPDEMADAFAKAGIDFSKTVVATCGSGLTAAVLAFGAYLLGHENVAVYDGSWAEWGNREDLPYDRSGPHPGEDGGITPAAAE
ncbi:MAG: 3-mercaptopyruvate sulfurtransferase [Magnetospirillum sp. WYHS-4]